MSAFLASLMPGLSRSIFGCGSLVRMNLPNSNSAGVFLVVGCGVERTINRCLFISAFGFLCSTIAVCQIFLQCFMKASASPLASGSSALFVGWWCIPAHLKYACSLWLSLPLNGGPPSVLSDSQNPCRANMLSNASMFESAPVEFTIATSG